MRTKLDGLHKFSPNSSKELVFEGYPIRFTSAYTFNKYWSVAIGF